MKILFYIFCRTPSGVIYRTEETKIPAPFIASFSSRGPNHGAKHLLKVYVTQFRADKYDAVVFIYLYTACMLICYIIDLVGWRIYGSA